MREIQLQHYFNKKKTHKILTPHAIEIKPFAEFIAYDESYRFWIFQLLQKKEKRENKMNKKLNLQEFIEI